MTIVQMDPDLRLSGHRVEALLGAVEGTVGRRSPIVWTLAREVGLWTCRRGLLRAGGPVEDGQGRV